MQVVGVAEVTPELDLKLGQKLKRLLRPGEKVKIKIESINSNGDKKKKGLEAAKLSEFKRLMEEAKKADIKIPPDTDIEVLTS